MIFIIDTHVHYDHKRFSCGRELVLESVKSSGVDVVINPAISMESNYRMREMFDSGIYDWIYYGVGIHPRCVLGDMGEDFSEDSDKEKILRNLAKKSKVVAIGETGLDYHNDPGVIEKERQKNWFRKMIEIAKDVKLPLIIHIRGDAAHKDAIEILKEYSFVVDVPPGVIHCFQGDKNIAKIYTEMGFKLGIGGMVTYPSEIVLRETVKNLSLEHIVLETDCPFLPPEGFGRKRNSSESLSIIAKSISDLTGKSITEIYEITNHNARKIFKNIEEKRCLTKDLIK